MHIDLQIPRDEPPPPAWQRPVQAAAYVAFFLLAALIAVEVVAGARAFGLWWAVPPLALAGYVVADLLSGIVHFLADNFGSEETPFFGPAFIRPFREHHVHPRGILTHGFWVANGNNALVSVPLLAVVAWGFPVATHRGWFLAGTFLLCMTLAVFVTNQFHKWAHMESPPSAIARLQRWGLILSREHHDVHHTSPHNTHYCITLGLWDGLLERIRFFDRLERALRRWVPGTHPATRVEREQAAGG
jgi:plasmanylethanolamine desaturase